MGTLEQSTAEEDGSSGVAGRPRVLADVAARRRLDGAVRRLLAEAEAHPDLLTRGAAAIEAVLEDAGAGGSDGVVIVLDPHTLAVSLGESHLRLTPTEWRLMRALVGSPGVALSREELARRAWGDGCAHRASEVEVYVSRLRRKLKHAGEMIRTVRGSGYCLDMDGATARRQSGDGRARI